MMKLVRGAMGKAGRAMLLVLLVLTVLVASVGAAPLAQLTTSTSISMDWETAIYAGFWIFGLFSALAVVIVAFIVAGKVFSAIIKGASKFKIG